MTVADLAFSAPSAFDAMDALTERVQRFLQQHVPDEDLAFRVALVTSEAVTNAIEHGNRFDLAKQIHVRVRTDADEVTVEVEDEGQGFDPTAVPDPIHEGPLLAEGGRGLYLMQQLADEVRYEREGRSVVCTLRPR